jgi:cytochrome c-type biogenesis protein CcmH/NrfF
MAADGRRRASPTVEDEVMCPICGTLLELAKSPQAERRSASSSSARSRWAKTKAEIEDALVTQYGRAVLALPRGSGFDLSAYLVPAIAVVVCRSRAVPRRAPLAAGHPPHEVAGDGEARR